jgi:ribosome biogenesis GTPase
VVGDGRRVNRYDEPAERGTRSRRRSKDRPDFADAVVGMVVAVDRGRITCVHPDGVAHGDQVVVTAVKARELGRKSVVVGDKVRLVGDLSGRTDTLARLVGIQERSTVLTRTADDADPYERVIVANADQLAIVVAAANPEPRVGLIDRALVAAVDAGVEPLLIVTKADLADPAAVTEIYAGMALASIAVDQTTGSGLPQVRAALAGCTTVLLGHSGVGKSTLVNTLVPLAQRVTGDVNVVTGRGKHTSTSAVALALPDDPGWVVDTPGIRSFGLAHVDPGRIISSFPEFAAGAVDCPRACTHVSQDGGSPPDCALDAWVAAGDAGDSGPVRLASLRRLLTALQQPSS